jgi:hypothetical protein
MSTNALNPVEMFNELIRQGFILPVGEHPDLTLPTAHRTVPTMTSSGTGAIQPSYEVSRAQLDSPSKGNSENAR